jgi:hypothetical protein
MAVVTKRERHFEIVGQALEPAEMPGPVVVFQFDQTHPLGPAPIEKPRRALWKIGRLDSVVEILA